MHHHGDALLATALLRLGGSPLIKLVQHYCYASVFIQLVLAIVVAMPQLYITIAVRYDALLVSALLRMGVFQILQLHAILSIFGVHLCI